MPCIESFFSHFKSEIFNLNSYQNKKELLQAIKTSGYHYNYKRFQKALYIEPRLNIEFRWLFSPFYSCRLDRVKVKQSIQRQICLINKTFDLIT
ncbi:IS3 family transposase [Bacillus toyonensis]|uniref:IS3 family transposase n=1 Tax=Bacillus toyonensis TaxID=155322 RepID=UPI00352A57E9